MNANAPQQQLRETGWRRKLTEAEQVELRSHMAARSGVEADLEAEAALTESLNRLSDVPVASNFTTRVLQAIEREMTAPSRLDRLRHWWQSLAWVPTAASAVLVAGVSLLVYQRQQIATRMEVAESLAAVAKVRSLPPYAEVLQDFEAIRRLSQAPPADEELLALLR